MIPIISITSTGFLCYKNGDYTFYKLGEALDTPFYRFPKVTKEVLEDIKNKQSIILNKKDYFNIFGKNNKKIKDLNTILWYNDREIMELPDNDNLSSHVEVCRTFESMMKDLSLNYPEENDTVLHASNILDGKLIIDKNIYVKNFNHFTKSGRLRDKANTISIPKDVRKKYKHKKGKLHIDMTKFHLYIIDRVLNINMLSPDEDPIKSFMEITQIKDVDEMKKEAFRALYSEAFDIDHPFFDEVRMKYKKLKAPLKPTKNFNYKIQQYESLIMSGIIILNKELNPYLYLYDGIIFDTDKTRINSLGYPYKTL